MTKNDFEALLDSVSRELTSQAQHNTFETSKQFEDQVRKTISELGASLGIRINFNPHPYAFPDIAIGEFGVEVKFTTNETWRSVANSVFESMRNTDVKHVYLMFGKMGGEKPEVRWATYENCVMHVRTSHVPRFEVEIGTNRPLFKQENGSPASQFDISYDTFCTLSEEEKMHHVRKYARQRLKEGERLWWLGDDPEKEHTLPLQVRLYMHLPQAEKRKLRAEAALLSPRIVMSSRTRNKYNDAVMYLLTYHGVLCPQARDLFTAGSVALRGNETRGGNYVERALKDIEAEMRDAALRLEDALFVEYWGKSVAPKKRISEWLSKADALARDWTPSQTLFK